MNSPKTHLSILIGVFLFVVAIRVYVVVVSDMRGVDSAYITYRYAENIAAGNGFVYNVGERVLGVVTPLYTILLALFALAHLPLPFVSQILGIAASGLIGILLYLYCRRVIPGAACILPPLLYALWPNAVNTDISGTEMTLFSLALLSFFYALLTARYRAALVVSALSALVRPEGVLLIVLYFLFKFTLKLHNFKRDYLPDLLVVTGVLLPWFAFSAIYFGSPIPQAVDASLAWRSGLENDGSFRRFIELLHLSSPVGWIVTLGALWGIGYSLMRIYWGWLEALFAMLIIAGLALSGVHLFFWYSAPVTVLLALFLGIGAAGGFALLGSIVKNKLVVQIISIALILSAIPVVGNSFSAVVSFNKQQARTYRFRRRMSVFLSERAKSAMKAPALVTEDIGYPGFYYRGQVIDRDGFVTPSAIERNRFQEYTGFLEDCLKAYPGHWLALNKNSSTTPYILKSGILERSYQIDSVFASLNSQDYLLFRAGER